MKFLSLALAALLTAPCIEAAKALSGGDLSAMLRSGKVDVKKLLQQAKPYSKSRILEEAAQEEEEEQQEQEEEEQEEQEEEAEEEEEEIDYGYVGYYGLSGDNSLTFNKCVSVTVEEDWENTDNVAYLADLILDGTVQSVRSYVLINVCTTRSDCVAEEDNSENTYMIELGTFVQAMLSYLPDQKDVYCTGCAYQQDYCQNDFYSMGFNNMNVDYRSANFFYNDEKFQLIDCEQCFALGCYGDQDAYDENGWDYVAEWIENIGGCYQTASCWNDVSLYAGWICNEDGSGIELGVFADQYCTLYDSAKQYSRLIEDGSSDWEYYSKSTGVINYMFNTEFDCYGGDVNFVNMYQQVYYDENDSADYDPCAIDDSTGYYMNYNQCMQALDENPCYQDWQEDQEQYWNYMNGNNYNGGNYNGNNNGNNNNNNGNYNNGNYNGNGNGDDEEEQELSEDCQEYMNQYPCWTLPGQDVSAQYEEDCEAYKAGYTHAANDACAALMSDGIVALVGCENYVPPDEQAYYDDDAAQNENQQQDYEEQAAGQYNFSNVPYDVAATYCDEDDEDNEDDEANCGGNGAGAICYYVEEMYAAGTLSRSDYTNVYDSSSSGTLYDFEEPTASENRNRLFPVVTYDSDKLKGFAERLSPVAIAAIAVAAALVGIAVMHCLCRCCLRRRGGSKVSLSPGPQKRASGVTSPQITVDDKKTPLVR